MVKEVKDFINLGIIINKNKVLMVRRRKREKGKDGAILEWGFPGARQALDETREESVKRGLLFKTGYDVEAIKQISLRMHPQFLVFIVYHLCRLKSDKPIVKPKEPHEIAEIKWIKKENVKKLITTNLDEKVEKELRI